MEGLHRTPLFTLSIAHLIIVDTYAYYQDLQVVPHKP